MRIVCASALWLLAMFVYQYCASLCVLLESCGATAAKGTLIQISLHQEGEIKEADMSELM